MSNADFYLDIARQELRQLEACDEQVSLGSTGYSAHFRHAVVCSVFAAFAVEYALAELIWTRCFFQTPKPYRGFALQHASRLRTIPDKLEFIRATTNIPSDLLEDMRPLFDYRNRIAHARVKTFDGKVLDFDSLQDAIAQGRGSELARATDVALGGRLNALESLADELGKETKFLQLAGLGSEDLDAAQEHLKIAEGAVEALRRELNSAEWPPCPPK